MFSQTRMLISAEFDKPGSTTVGIQEAIDSLPATGGAVFVPLGRHQSTGTITVPSNVALLGAGKEKSIIEFPTGCGGRLRFKQHAQHASLSGLSVYIRDNPSLFAEDIQWCTLRDMYVSGGSAFTVYLRHDGIPARPEDWLVGCRILDSDFTKDPAVTSKQDTFGGGGWKDWLIANCTFSGTGHKGQGNIGLSSRNVDGALVSNCVFCDNPASGTSLEDGINSLYSNCRARNNGNNGFFMNQVAATPPLTRVGIENCIAMDNDQSGFLIELTDYARITGISSGNGGRGCVLEGCQYCEVDVIAQGNGASGIAITEGQSGRAARYNRVMGISIGNAEHGVTEGTGDVDHNLIGSMIVRGNAGGNVNKRGKFTTIGQLMTD